MKRLFLVLGGVLLPLILSGCYDFERRITWSADGKTMAVIGENGLRLCELDGEVSEVLVEGVRLAEWTEIDGEEKLVVLRYRRVDRWAAIEEVLVEQLREAAIREGDAIVAALRAGETWSEHFSDQVNRHPELQLHDQWEEMLRLYVAAKLSPEEMHKIGKQVEPAKFAAHIGEIVVFPRREGLALGEPEHVTGAFLDSFDELRLSPAGSHAAFVIDGSTTAEGLWVVALSDATPPQQAEIRVQEGAVGFSPDWTPDGLSLVYTRPDVQPEQDSSTDVSLGFLVRRQIFREGGGLIEEQVEAQLAWLLFYEFGRVRCLADGGVLCSAIEARFPATSMDLPQSDQLYQFDPDRPATLVRMLPEQALANLPDFIAFYEVSPDGKKIVVIDPTKSIVSAADLVHGESYPLQEDDLSDIAWMPSWTPDGQLCYRGRLPKTGEEEADAPKPKVEVILWDGKNFRVISEGWPKDLRDSLDLSTS